MEKPIKLAIVLFNSGMFAATGESDKPAITLMLTKKQSKLIRDSYKNNFSVLSIHIIE